MVNRIRGKFPEHIITSRSVKAMAESETGLSVWPAIRKKIPTFVMVPNFVMVVKFPNSSEIRNGSESPGMVVKFQNSSEIRNGSEIFRNGFDSQ